MESSIMGALADDGTATVSVRGEIDFSNADELADCLRNAVTGWEPTLVRVDLSAATFIDSTGLGALIFGFQRARDAGIRFRLARPSRTVHQTLVLSGLLEVVELTP